MVEFEVAFQKAKTEIKHALEIPNTSIVHELTENTIEEIIEKTSINKIDAALIIEKAAIGGEISNHLPPNDWLHKRFFPNIVEINVEDYALMCIDALKIVGRTAGTDYGSSRQRDMGQLWADMTRGYLGEMAVALFFKQKYNIDTELGHEIGDLSDYLPTDIHLITLPGESPRPPKIDIGIKATKLNGIWFDIPGDQFNHSDIHILVKVGIGRDHLFSFFKEISVFKDKVLKKGIELGSISSSEATKLFDDIPSFNPITAYLCGFAEKNKNYPEFPYSYSGKKGRINYTIKEWCGKRFNGDLNEIKQREEIVAGKVTFEGIGSFSHDTGYLFNTGSLEWKKEGWDEVINRL